MIGFGNIIRCEASKKETDDVGGIFGVTACSQVGKTFLKLLLLPNAHVSVV